MIAALGNLLLALLILGAVVFLIARYGIPAVRRMQDEELRVRRHEAWLREQARRESGLRAAAEQELERELGPVEAKLDPPVAEDRQNKERA